jgi:hypothetical protein
LEDVFITRTFDPDGPTFVERRGSTDPLFADSFFDITYRIPEHQIDIEMVQMNLSGSFDPIDVRHRTSLTSDDPTNGFFDIE